MKKGTYFLRLPLENPKQSNPESPMPSKTTPGNPSELPAAVAPAFKTLHARTLVLADILRAIIIVATLIVTVGLTLVLLPQSAIDSMAERLQARHKISHPEKIALLYLGHELDGNRFQIRGVVRNITTAPIEQLDAIIRLYDHDRDIRETMVVRLSKETINPGELAQFALVYPDYKQEFGSYSVEFKLRQGKVLPYKDMRALRNASD